MEEGRSKKEISNTIDKLKKKRKEKEEWEWKGKLKKIVCDYQS